MVDGCQHRMAEILANMHEAAALCGVVGHVCGQWPSTLMAAERGVVVAERSTVISAKRASTPKSFG